MTAATRLPVSAIMTRQVIAVSPTMLVRDLAELLSSRGISGAPVVDGAGHVLGVVSELDIIGRTGMTAGAIMSPQVVSISAETEVEEIAHLFTNRRIRRLPVLADGRLIGIVSRADLIRPAAVAHFLPGDQNDLCQETDQA